MDILDAVADFEVNGNVNFRVSPSGHVTTAILMGPMDLAAVEIIRAMAGVPMGTRRRAFLPNLSGSNFDKVAPILARYTTCTPLRKLLEQAMIARRSVGTYGKGRNAQMPENIRIERLNAAYHAATYKEMWFRDKGKRGYRNLKRREDFGS